METRQNLLDAWATLLDLDEPEVEKPALLAEMVKLINSTTNKASDSWPPPVKSLLNAPPGAPTEGARHAVGPTPVGAWAGQAHTIATWDGTAWGFAAPPNGALLLCTDTEMVLQRRNSEWLPRALSAVQRVRNTGPLAVNSTSPVDLAALNGMVQAGRRYRVHVELLLSCSTTADAPSGLKLGLLGPSCMALAITAMVPDAAGHSEVAHSHLYGTDLVTTETVPNGGNSFRATLEAVLVAPASSDLVLLTLACNDAEDTLTVQVGSTVEITDITD